MEPVFRFKQFAVRHDRAGMKVGTDGVLLGAWAPLDGKPASILDIGAGTGLIALMLAQRSGAPTIDAVEVEATSYQQCVENFEASPWNDRLFCYHCSLQEFAGEVEETYDLLVSNPPFYGEAAATGNPARDAARRRASLPFETLLEGVRHLMAPGGRFCVVLPRREEAAFTSLAREAGLYPGRITRVRGNPQAPFSRSLLAFTEVPGEVAEDTLTIEAGRGQYTEAYQALTRAFYLKM